MSGFDSGRPPCKKCLLEDLDPEGVSKSVHEYIGSLDPSVKAADDEYRRRLGLCLRCGHLNQGTCALCGCFVEARAAKTAQRCPAGSW